MNSADKGKIICGTHGEVGPAFVCCHLVHNTDIPVGFNEPNLKLDDPDYEDDAEPQAWCDACDAMLERDGEWTVESEKFADIRLVCEFCFERLRQLHQHAT